MRAFSKDWKDAARSLGVQVIVVAALPVGAAFAVDGPGGTVWAPEGESGCAWAAWAGLTTIVAKRNDLTVELDDVCALATEMQCASGLFVVSDSA